MEVRAGVEDSSGRPLPRTDMKITLTSPSGKVTPVELEIAKTMRRGKLRTPAEPGLYRLKVIAPSPGTEGELEAEHQFEVVRRDLEALEVLSNHDLLRRISAESNGRYVTIDHLDQLLRELRTTAEPRTETLIIRHDLAEVMRWWVVVLLIALLCVEWIARKRRGLI